MRKTADTSSPGLADRAALEARLREAEEALEAIRNGEVDAVVVNDGRQERVYTLAGADESYRVFLQTMHEGAATVAPSGVCTFCNPAFAALVGASKERVVGVHIREFISAGSWPAIEKLLSGGRGSLEAAEMAFKRPDGRSVAVSVSAGPLSVEGLNAIYLVAADLSERKLAEEQVRSLAVAAQKDRDAAERSQLETQLLQYQKLESLGVLAGGLAHDFNNLLNGIFGYLELAKEECEPGSPAARLLEQAMQPYDRARGLARQLLTFAKGGEPVRKVTDMARLLRECVNFALSGTKAMVDVRVQPDLWACDCDAGQIGQAVDNLLINGQQAMPQGGDLSIAACNLVLKEGSRHGVPAGRYVKISVTDSGSGIRPEILPRIFDPFFTTKQAGAGLGLSTSYSIAARHGGILEAESILGKGSTFTLLLPAAEAEIPAASPPVPGVLPKGKGRVLVMDDDPSMRDLLGLFLSRLDFQPVLVESGEEALAAYRRSLDQEEEFTAAILDLTLPGGMGGKEVAAQIRKTDARLPIIAASGYSEDPVIADPARFGFTASLAKPINLAAVAETMKAFVLHADPSR